jgi:carbon-monoxide dehydrogenase large subunit
LNVWAERKIWPAAEPVEAWIGRPLRRREDERLVRGCGRYVDDIAPQDCLHLEFFRSTYPRGVICAIDVETARARAGVVAVFTHHDLALTGEAAVNPLIANIRPPRFTVLAEQTIGAVGQPIAAVVARSVLAARDAAELIEVTVDEQSPLAGGPETQAITGRWVSGEVAQAFAAAAHVVGIGIEHPRLAPMPLEPRAAVAEWSEAEGVLTMWLSTQTPHRARTDLANMLDLPEEKIRVIAPDVGGAFGGKASIYPEDVMVAWAARALRRPVKWCATRSEDFQAATHGRGARTAGELAVAADGRVLALRAQLAFPLGHWLPYSAAAPGRNASRILPGPYCIDAIDVDLVGTLTSTAAVGIYRGAGRPEACMLMERLMDRAAAATGLDPIAIRRRNLIGPESFPYRTPTGETLDSGDYPALVAKACNLADYETLCRTRNKRRRRGEITGVGVAIYIEPCGEGWESARIGLSADGRIIAATGASSQGQGRETAYAQIVSEVLRVEPERVVVVHGDTGATLAGTGALASRSTAIGGSALKIATQRFLDKAKIAASHIVQVAPDLMQQDDRGFARAGKLRVTWAMLAQQAFTEAVDVVDGEALVTTEIYHAKGEAWSSGCCIASVSVAAETGEVRIEKLVWVDDAGVVVNPMLVHGQLVGGMAQGIGETLMEQIVYDANGQLVTGSLMDYAVPRSADVPPVIIDKIETVSPANVLGAKGVGEAGCIGVPAAIVNAVVDALSVRRVTHLDMPLTREKVWRALNPENQLKKATVP